MNPGIRPSENFKNPVGLLFRMLMSGQRAAYSTLIHEAMRLASQPLNSLLAVWCAVFGKPLLNKNNRNAGCLDLLARAIPQSSIVVVRRSPLLVAQSLIHARQQVQGHKSVGWGLHSHSSDITGDPLAYVDDVCDQVLRIETELDEQMKHNATHPCDSYYSQLISCCGAKILRRRFAEVVLVRELLPHQGSASVTGKSQSSRHAPP